MAGHSGRTEKERRGVERLVAGGTQEEDKAGGGPAATQAICATGSAGLVSCALTIQGRAITRHASYAAAQATRSAAFPAGRCFVASFVLMAGVALRMSVRCGGNFAKGRGRDGCDAEWRVAEGDQVRHAVQVGVAVVAGGDKLNLDGIYQRWPLTVPSTPTRSTRCLLRTCRFLVQACTMP